MNEVYEKMERAAKRFRECEEAYAKAQFQSVTARENETGAEIALKDARRTFEQAAREWRKGLLELTPALDLHARRGA